MEPAHPVLLSPFGWLRSLRSAPLLVVIAVGVVLGDLSAGRQVLPPLLLGLCAGFGSLLLLVKDVGWKRVGIAGVAFTLGHTAAARVYRPHLPSDHIAAAPVQVRLHVEGVLQQDPQARGAGQRLWMAAERVDSGDGWRAAHGLLLLSVRQPQRAWYAGDRIRARVSLRRPRNFGNPGGFDYEGYLARRRVYVTAFAFDDSEFERLGHTERWLMARWRGGIGALFHRVLPEPEAALLSALIVGTSPEVPEDVRAAFRRAGVSHVLSISGLHVGLVAAAAYALLRWLLARSRWILLSANVPKLAIGLSVVPVLLYAGIAGGNVATIRAVIMSLVFLGAVAIDRQRQLIVSLAVAAIAILVHSPGAAADISFQLSFAAVLGLVYGMQRFWPWWTQREEVHLVRLRGWRARLWRPIAAYVAVSVSAVAATMPLTALHFNHVSLMALVANAVVVPLLGSIAVTLGLLAAVTYLIWRPLAHVCVALAGPFVSLGLWFVQAVAAWPYAALRVVTPTAVELALMYGALWVLVRRTGRTRVLSLCAIGLVAFGDGAWWYASRYHRPDLRITFLSVGQGDSAVVEFPGAEVMVIDGGGLRSDTFDVGERIIAPFLWSRKIARIDYLVLSHPQWDHYGGFTFLAAHFAPREFWSNGTRTSSEWFRRLQEVLQTNGVRRLTLQRGARRRIGPVELVVHSPPPALRGLSRNDQSLVLSLGFGDAHVLFTGDIESVAENSLVTLSDGELASTILKVPHHGSRTSSTAPFLRAVRPQLAVVSAGFQNRFGFPHEDVLHRYAALPCVVARTDLDGAVQVRVGRQGTIGVRRYRDERQATALQMPHGAMTGQVAGALELPFDSPARRG